MKGRTKPASTLHVPNGELKAPLMKTTKLSANSINRPIAFRRHGSFTSKTIFPVQSAKDRPVKLENYFTTKPSHDSNLFDTLGGSSSKTDSFCHSNLRSSRQIPKSQTSVSSLVQDLMATKPFPLAQSSFKEEKTIGTQSLAPLNLASLKSPDTLAFKKLSQKTTNLAVDNRRNENMDFDGYIKDQYRKIESRQNLEKKFRQIDHNLAFSQQNILRHKINLLKNLEVKFNGLNNSGDKINEKIVHDECSSNRLTDKSGKRSSITRRNIQSISQSRRMTFEASSFPHPDTFGSFGKKHSRIGEQVGPTKKTHNELEFSNVFKILNFLGKDKTLHQNRKKLQHKIKELNREALHNVARQQPHQKDLSKDEESIMSDYNIQQVLGRGSYGEVKLALHLKSNLLHAVKIYPKKFLADEVKRENIENEKRLLAQLCHPNIISLKEVVYGSKYLYLVTEYGGPFSLHEYLTKGTKNCFSEKEARPLIRQLCRALNYLHERNIVHRDIKLHNVLLNDDNLKLIDFGFACQIADSELLKVFCGTPSYMSPEILGRKPYFGKPCDIWALGVCVYRMVIGSFPFRANTEEELFKKIKAGKFNLPSSLSDDLKVLIENMLKIDPNERITTSKILKSCFFVK